MTAEQQKAQERLTRYISRESLVSVMNDTKWQEAIQAFRGAISGNVRFRVKELRGGEPPADRWESGFPEHLPHPYKHIEWLEVDPVVRLPRGALLAPAIHDCTQAVEEALRRSSVPFHLTGGIIRLHGYLRPARPPA